VNKCVPLVHRGSKVFKTSSRRVSATRELGRLRRRIEPVGGSKDQWEAGVWHMDKEQWNLLWTGEQWVCGSLQERTEETELWKWEPMARPQRVPMLLAGVSLLLNHAETFNVPRVCPRAGVRRVAGNARHRRGTRMPFSLGQAEGTTLAREVARIAALPVLLLMVRRCRTSATITTFAGSSDTEKRTDTHVRAELKHAAFNTFFKIIPACPTATTMIAARKNNLRRGPDAVNTRLAIPEDSDTQTRALFWLYPEFFTALFFKPPRTRVAEGHTHSRPVCGNNNRHKVAVRRVVLMACGWLQILGPDRCITDCYSVLYQPPGVLGSIPKREEPGKTGAPRVRLPGSSTVPEELRGGGGGGGGGGGEEEEERCTCHEAWMLENTRCTCHEAWMIENTRRRPPLVPASCPCHPCISRHQPAPVSVLMRCDRGGPSKYL
jgi:hypothetical protein